MVSVALGILIHSFTSEHSQIAMESRVLFDATRESQEGDQVWSLPSRTCILKQSRENHCTQNTGISRLVARQSHVLQDHFLWERLGGKYKEEQVEMHRRKRTRGEAASGRAPSLEHGT